MKRVHKISKFILLSAVSISLLFGAGCSNRNASGEVYAMDTYMTYTIYGKNCDRAASLANEEIHRLDELLSTGIPGSEVSQINENQGGMLSEDTAYLWEVSGKVYEESEGAFDITVYPVMKAWGFGSEEQAVPEKEELEALLTCVDYSKANLDEEEKKLVLPAGTQIDFGGIAKGYTGDRLVSIMKEQGIEHALFNLGGNVQVMGGKPDGSDYHVGIKDPDGSGTPVGILSIKDGAVVSSGGYERFFEQDGKVYHHIIDPKTGYPADKGLKSVTVICDNGTLADGYSTALFVMGPDEAEAFWKEHAEEFQAILVTDKGEIRITEGLKDRFTSVNPYEIVQK